MTNTLSIQLLVNSKQLYQAILYIHFASVILKHLYFFTIRKLYEHFYVAQGLTVLIWGCEHTQGSFRESMPANTNN